MKFNKAIWLFLLVVSVTVTGCVKITDGNGADVPLKLVRGDQFSSFALGDTPSTEESRFKAMLKGSIYETGEFMSVFGACLDGEDNPINGTYAQFNAWYPNGTQFIFNTSMSELIGNPGYYLHQSYMENVQGTYLTNMECRITGDNSTRALAFGEWQNPYWVYRLNLLNGTLSDISTQLTNVSMQINNVSIEMGQGFNITWDKLDQINSTLNQSFYDLNQSIYYVAMIANASVDRNDSYLAMLIQNLTGFISGNISGDPLDYEIVMEQNKVYMKGWTIKVRAVEVGDDDVVPPGESACYITTTQTPTRLMNVQGSHWAWTETIQSLSHTHTISCQYS